MLQQTTIEKVALQQRLFQSQICEQLSSKLDNKFEPLEVVRLKLEQRVLSKHLAFYEAGKALMELRDRKLYLSTHQTFKHYCESFGFGYRYVYRLIAAAAVVENLALGCPIASLLPNSERQIRPLLGLSPDQQRDVWQEALTLTSGQTPTGSIVANIVQHKKEKSAPLEGSAKTIKHS